MPRNNCSRRSLPARGESLTQAATRIPSYRAGRATTLSCLLRWVTIGIKGLAGERIHLEAARLSGRWITTPGAIQRFLAAQQPEVYMPTQAPPRSPSKRMHASEKAAEQLAKAGI